MSDYRMRRHCPHCRNELTIYLPTLRVTAIGVVVSGSSAEWESLTLRWFCPVCRKPDHITLRIDEEDDYEYLRDGIIKALNPYDSDEAEPWIMLHAVQRISEYVAGQPCGCTEDMIEDFRPCSRCGVLGRVGDVKVDG